MIAMEYTVDGRAPADCVDHAAGWLGALFRLVHGVRGAVLFTVEGLEFMNFFTDGGREYGKYPIDVYGRCMLQFATFVIPYAPVQYYPLQYLLGRSCCWLYVLYPLGALLFLAVCYALWRVGVAHYTSTGS